MNVGVCKVKLRFPENQSLKGKRRVVSALCSRIHNRSNVAIAEVSDNHAWQMATLGITCVSNSSQNAEHTLNTIVSYIESTRQDVELLESQVEAIYGY
ncbi:DUF503 domain-containing protein [Dehalococcoidia bacterium]|nr:DUF503 domain-containing protein [Dehalococcoidia bacterium]